MIFWCYPLFDTIILKYIACVGHDSFATSGGRCYGWYTPLKGRVELLSYSKFEVAPSFKGHQLWTSLGDIAIIDVCKLYNRPDWLHPYGNCAKGIMLQQSLSERNLERKWEWEYRYLLICRVRTRLWRSLCFASCDAGYDNIRENLSLVGSMQRGLRLVVR